MKTLLVILPIVILIAIGCKKESERNVYQIDMVTGISAKDINGLSLKEFGNPNINDSGIAVFPNPVATKVYIISNQSIKKVWLVQGVADYSYTLTDFDNILKGYQYSQSDISRVSFEMFTNDTTRLTLDLSSIENPYVRVFLLLENDSIYWSNVRIMRDGPFFWEGYNELEQEWK